MTRMLIDDFKGWRPWEYTWLTTAVMAIAIVSYSMGGGWLAFVSSITNVVCVILVAQGKITNYLWGIVGVISYGIVSYQWGYYGESFLNFVYYAPMQLIGFWLWADHRRDVGEPTKVVESRKPSTKEKTVAAIVIPLAILIGAVILELLGGKLTVLDSSTTVLSVVAMYAMAVRLREQWIIWFWVNGISIVMWVWALVDGNPAGAPVLIMWVVFLINSVFGYYKWGKTHAMQYQTKTR